MKIKKINNKLNLEEQFDVNLQGCLDDCQEYTMKDQVAIRAMKAYDSSIDFTSPNSENMKKIARAANAMGVKPCYIEETAKGNIFF